MNDGFVFVVEVSQEGNVLSLVGEVEGDGASLDISNQNRMLLTSQVTTSKKRAFNKDTITIIDFSCHPLLTARKLPTLACTHHASYT